MIKGITTNKVVLDFMGASSNLGVDKFESRSVVEMGSGIVDPG